MGLLKGKLAMRIFQSYPNMEQNPYWGNHFRAKGFFISTIGLDEEMIRSMFVIKKKKNVKGTSTNVYPPP